MLETVMTINIAEFEHFYSVEENNYLTRWQNRKITKSVANIKEEKSLKERIMLRKQAREKVPHSSCFWSFWFSGFATGAERSGWKLTLAQNSCRFSPKTFFKAQKPIWSQIRSLSTGASLAAIWPPSFSWRPTGKIIALILIYSSIYPG